MDGAVPTSNKPKGFQVTKTTSAKTWRVYLEVWDDEKSFVVQTDVVATNKHDAELHARVTAAAAQDWFVLRVKSIALPL
jgi:hypothetical protein